MKLIIIKTFLISLVLQLFFQIAFAQIYENSQQEKTVFNEFVQYQKGILICKAIEGYIYEKGITSYVFFDRDRKKYILSAYDNNSEKWLRQDVEVTLRSDLNWEDIAYFNSVDSWFSFEIGVGERRDFVSLLGDRYASSEFPYAGSFTIQFHNICKIENP